MDPITRISIKSGLDSKKYTNKNPKIAEPQIPPRNPSNVLFGLISLSNEFFPKKEPTKYAELSDIAELKIIISIR